MGLVPGNRVLLRGPNTLQMAVACARGAEGRAASWCRPCRCCARRSSKQIIDKAQVSAALCDARLTDELGALQRSARRVLLREPAANAPLSRRRAPIRSTRSPSPSPPTSPLRHRRRRRLPDRVHVRHDRQAEGLRCTSIATCWRCATCSRATCCKPHRRRHLLRHAAARVHVRARRAAVLSAARRRVDGADREAHARDAAASVERFRRDHHVHRADVLPADGARSSRASTCRA